MGNLAHPGLLKITENNGGLVGLGKKGQFYYLPKAEKTWKEINLTQPHNLPDFDLNVDQFFVFNGDSLFHYELEL